MKKKSRKQMIKELVNLVDDWDIDTLLEFSKSHLTEIYECLTDRELRFEYDGYLGDKPE